jgi:FHS family glucose/mannose:H+ symporter-like MFS transporter
MNVSATRAEIALIYLAGVVQGLALVTFPAASAIFTSPDGFGFDSTRYGAMFLPQVLLAVLASALAPKLAQRWGLRRVLLIGLAGDVASMALLAVSRLLIALPDTAFAVLLVATGALGLGFGATVMALNTYVEAFFPRSSDRAVLILNALLGVGTALAPLLIAVVVAIGAWWLLPLLVACILIVMFSFALLQPLNISSAAADYTTPAHGNGKLPHRFWLYAAAVFSYGVVETLNGNWAVLYLSSERGASARSASLALTAFWVAVTVGRVFVAVISRWIPARWIYVALPMLLVLIFQVVARVHGDIGGIVGFALAGLACSAFLPLSISFGGNEFPQLAAKIAGNLIAFYQLGYGVAAFGIGPLRDWVGLSFHTIFAAGGLVAALVALFALLVIRRLS